MSKIAILLPKANVSVKQFNQVKQVCEAVFEEVHYFSESGDSSELTIRKWSELEMDSDYFQGLIVPDGMGWYDETDSHIGSIICYFAKSRKPICMIGTGLASIAQTLPINHEPWIFDSYSIAAPNLKEDLESNVLEKLIISEIIVTYGGKHCCTTREKPYLVVGITR